MKKLYQRKNNCIWKFIQHFNRDSIKWIVGFMKGCWFDNLILMFQKEVERIWQNLIHQIMVDYRLSNWKLNIEKICDIKRIIYTKPKVDSSLLVFSPKISLRDKFKEFRFITKYFLINEGKC